MTRTVAVSTFPLLVAAACGEVTNAGPDGGDAGPQSDGSTQPDAMVTTGLGQLCDPSLAGADCPASAANCFDLSGDGVGYCSPLCIEGETVTTDAAGNLPPNPGANLVCENAFSGAAGTPVCNIVVMLEPPDNFPLQPNTTYVYTAACGIGCNTPDLCPVGLTCDLGSMLCLP